MIIPSQKHENQFENLQKKSKSKGARAGLKCCGSVAVNAENLAKPWGDMSFEKAEKIDVYCFKNTLKTAFSATPRSFALFFAERVGAYFRQVFFVSFLHPKKKSPSGLRIK